VRRVNAELRTSFVGHHVSAIFELRADTEHSSILITVMADFSQE
jgi:hypothetical protein